MPPCFQAPRPPHPTCLPHFRLPPGFQQAPPAPCHTSVLPRRPSVRGADDASNFDDYSELGPMQHAFQLSETEQALFVGF